MARGVDPLAFARRWGRAGVVVAVLAACAGQPVASAPPTSSRSTGADGAAEAPVDQPIPPAPATFEGPPPAPRSPPPQLVSPAATGSGMWAVVVGIDDYPGSAHDLRFARNDAADVEAVLVRQGVAPEHRVHLADGQATAVNIGRALDWLTASAGPDATAVFFYAGHVRKLGSTTEALVGADGKLVTDVEVARRLRPLRAGRAWLVVAGCYGGGFTEALAPGRILTAAAGPNQLAFESTALHRSYLVEYLFRRAMLEGRAASSVEAAFAWAQAALRREHPNRVPVEYDQLAGDLSLALRASSPPPPPPPPPPPTTAPPHRPATTTTTTAPSRHGCLFTVGSTVRCPEE